MSQRCNAVLHPRNPLKLIYRSMVFLRWALDFAVGLVVTFVGIILAGLVGYDIFLMLGFPEEWFAGDFSDPRGSALCSALQFACVLLVVLAVRVILRRLGVEIAMARALRAINPVSWLGALLAVMLFEWPFEPEGQVFGVWSAIVGIVGWLLIVPIAMVKRRPHQGVN